MTTYARGASFTRVVREVPVSLVIAWALVVLISVGGGFLGQRMAATTAAQAETIASQSSTIANMTATATDTKTRLTACLADTATYKQYSAENATILRGIQEKWGVNYQTPIKDVYAMLQRGSDQLNCK
jgi:hypothetical protein